jgi:Mpv17 / PMP22 family
MQLNLPSIVVALAIVTCNAYATRADVASKGGRGGNNRGLLLVKDRSPTPGRYRQRRYFQIIGNSVADVKEQIPLTEHGVSSFANRLPSKKITGMALSSVLVLLVVVSASSHHSITVHSVRFLEKYKGSMVRFPLQTKVATGATLAVLGDALAQTRDPLQKHYDPRRAASFAAFDGCYRFFQHKAFPFIISKCQGGFLGGILSAMLGVSLGSNVRLGLAALERTLVYQFLVIPLLYYPIFFSFTGYLQGLKPKEIWRRARTSFLPCWKRNLLFWIPTQMIMFGLIDEKWQIPFACAMGMLWSMILSVTAGNAYKKA